MSAFKNILVIGASGNLGEEIVPALVNHDFNVTILTRPGSEGKHAYPKAKIVSADYSSTEELKKVFTGQDVILSMVGMAAVPDQTKWIDIAISAGVKRFIPSEFGSRTGVPALKATGLFDGKDKVKDYLREKAEKGEIEYTFFFTGPFVDWMITTGFVGIDGKNKTATIYDNGNSKFSGTPLYIIAERVVQALQHPETSKNKALETFTHTLTQNSILKAAEKVTGQKWTVKQGGKASDLAAKGMEMMKSGGNKQQAAGMFIQGMVLEPSDKFAGWYEKIPVTDEQETEKLTERALNWDKPLKH